MVGTEPLLGREREAAASGPAAEVPDPPATFARFTSWDLPVVSEDPRRGSAGDRMITPRTGRRPSKETELPQDAARAAPVVPADSRIGRIQSWDVPARGLPCSPAHRRVARSMSNPWALVAGTEPKSFENWARTSHKMGSAVPQRIGKASLGASFINTMTEAVLNPTATALDVATQLCQSLEELGDISSQEKERRLQTTLQFFILHYMFLFAFQAAVQVCITTVSVVNMIVVGSSTMEIVLISIDWMLVLLLLVELLSQVCVVGAARFLLLVEHRIDLVILGLSLSFCMLDTITWTRAPESGKLLEHLFDSLRMLLRLLRMCVFINQIYILLKHPLQLMPHPEGDCPHKSASRAGRSHPVGAGVGHTDSAPSVVGREVCPEQVEESAGEHANSY